jgi:hypothetical protein
VQNLHRGHHELGTDSDRRSPVAIAFAELAQAI